jgi:phosphoglycerol transferase MdoB-like AlkP superfamily enzyme
MKENTYTSKKEFHSTIDKPNIIILFSEGLSARTLSMYNNKFKDVTPHLQSFAQDPKTMIATEYYNHTAATYKGLHGQLCSFFPSLGGRQWNHSIANSENINYQCIGGILKDDNYNTSYLNVHYEEKSGNDDMASHLGYTHILSAKELSERYLGGVKHFRENELTDKQAYHALTGYMKERDDKPFFITMYTAETHAWCDTSEDGTVYKDGKNEVLNTIHNLDNAFGEFWDYFKHSKFADNTIVIFTADHAHYFDDAYVSLMKEKKEKYHKVFIDKIPLLIYAPTHTLPKTLTTNQSTSLDLAPTLMHLLNKKEHDNAFLGNTIFGREKHPEHIAIAAYNSNIYVLDKKQIHHNKFTSARGKKFFDLLAKFFAYTHQLELEDSIYK